MTEQLAAKHFSGVRKVGVSFIELEDGDILAYGHIEPRQMVEAVAAWYAEDVDPGGTLVSPRLDEVEHIWGVAMPGPVGGDEGPYIRTQGISQWTRNAVPVTRISG